MIKKIENFVWRINSSVIFNSFERSKMNSSLYKIFIFLIFFNLFRLPSPFISLLPWNTTINPTFAAVQNCVFFFRIEMNKFEYIFQLSQRKNQMFQFVLDRDRKLVLLWSTIWQFMYANTSRLMSELVKISPLMRSKRVQLFQLLSNR